ncbi:MAG: histone deacetylase [Thermoleophilia bacterium]|nr:histone deacetylase [Thermoleophilia bacterium]
MTEESGNLKVEGVGSVEHAYYQRDEPLTGVVLLPNQEDHDTGEHPENIRRLPPLVKRLRESDDWDRLFVMHPRSARFEDIARAHEESYVDSIRLAANDGPTWLDTDTKAGPGSYELALRSSGAGLTAVDAVAMEAYWQPDSLFALIRPPGHHATADRAMGFCLFNHASVAARYAQANYPIDRVAILDWDVHHGNGVQDIHWRDPSVLYISLHQWPLYPGTGSVDEVGEGEGEGFNVNLPMPPGSGDREYGQAIEAVVEPILDEFDPQLLIVSAGQDGHAADTLSNQMISATGFRDMAGGAAAFAKAKGIGLVVLHEGGYNVSTLPQLDHAILGGLGSFPTDLTDIFAEGAPPVSEWPDRLTEILKMQGRYWPGLVDR